MKKIMIVTPGSIKPKDKEKLSKNGCLVIEHEKPNEVRIITETDEITGNAVLMAAMEGIITSSTAELQFANHLAKRILATEKKQQ